MTAWRNWARRLPLIRQWRERRDAAFRVDGVILEAPSPPVSRSVRKSLRKNKYENAESYLVRHLVRPGDTVLDLGAGLGLTSIVAAKASGGGRIVAYEANPAIAPLAERNFQKNGVQVEMRNRAIAKEKGACDFHVRRSFTASSFIATRGSKMIRIAADAAREVLDEIRPQVLICDIEGIEKDVFTSANLSPVQRMVVEVHPQLIGLPGVQRCVQALTDAGLRQVPSLCVDQVLVFDRDGSSSSIAPFQGSGATNGKAPAGEGAGMA